MRKVKPLEPWPNQITATEINASKITAMEVDATAITGSVYRSFRDRHMPKTHDWSEGFSLIGGMLWVIL